MVVRVIIIFTVIVVVVVVVAALHKLAGDYPSFGKAYWLYKT